MKALFVDGYKVVADPFMVDPLKYPTGYKDGNRLGKRKRHLLDTKTVVWAKDATVFVSYRTYELLKKGT